MKRIHSSGIAELRRELASAEHQLRELAACAAGILAQRERAAWLEARDACHAFDRIRPKAEARLAAIRAGIVFPGRQTPERFAGEARLAEMALREADLADAAYTIISFASAPERMRYVRACAQRDGAEHDSSPLDSLLRETLKRGGVYDDRHFFMEVVK
ncbi:MAG: hypothetical protein WAM91_00625 [Candidatus Acidiferrales bacterium]